jgi:hypothetical protein
MQPNDVAAIAQKSSIVGPDSDSAKGIAAKSQNIDEYKNATNPISTAAPAAPAKDNTPSPKDRVSPKARFGARTGEQRIDTKDMTQPLGSFKKGTSHVPKTGIYKLHEGEAVIPKDKNMDSMKDKMTDALGGDEKKPKKEIKEMHIRKTANGKHIVTHKHHSPAHHPDEEHSMENMADLHQHLEDHAGTPNDGEGAESAPPAGAAQMTAAPSPAAAPAAGATPAGM